MSKRNKHKQNSNFRFSAPASSIDVGKIPFAYKTKEVRPWFSHRYICTDKFCLKKCDIRQFKSFADTLRILSQLEWQAIESSPHETHGYEMIPKSALKATLPQKFDGHDKVMVFRFGGAKGGRIAGIKEDDRFYILFIDSKFNLYDHG